jgi:hypothetical protein
MKCLNCDEAAFIATAFLRILPDDTWGAGGLDSRGAAYVDRQLGIAALASSRPTPTRADIYRAGIAAVQAHSVIAHGQRFQDLPLWHQLSVLAALEDGTKPFDDMQFRFLFFMLANDAAEAYFDAHSPWTGGIAQDGSAASANLSATSGVAGDDP